MAIVATRWTAAENLIKYNRSANTAGAVSLGQGLFGADGFQHCDLGGGKTLWTCGDTFWAKSAGKNRSQCVIVRNSVGITDNYDLSAASTPTWYAGGDPTDYPLPFFGNTHFNGVPYSKGTSGAVKLSSEIVLAWGALVRATPTFPGFALDGSWVTLLTNISDTPDNWQHIEVPFGAPADTLHHAGGRPFVSGGQVYFPMASGRMARVPVARALLGDLTNVYWFDGREGWVRDAPDRRGLNPQRRVQRYVDGAPFQRSDGQWQVTGGGLLDAVVEYDTADNMMGPFAPGDGLDEFGYHPTSRTFIYRPPGAEGVLAGHKYIYAIATVPWLTWSGKAAADQPIIYSTNGGTNGESVFTDARYYWPEFLQVSGL